MQIIELLSNIRTTCSSSATMASNSRSRRNAQQASAGSNQPEEAPVETTPTPSTASAPSQAPASAPAPALYTQEDLQRITKLCMDSFLQGNRQEGPREGQLKARFPDLYYGKSHMECYHFCQQCEDYFDTAGATRSNRTLFAASFLHARISFRWQKHKRWGQVGLLPWIDFKTFLQKNLGDSQAFINTTWSRVKRDSQFQQEELQDWASYLKHL